MKKLLLLAFVAFAAVSCESDDELIQSSHVFRVKASQWEYMEEGGYFKGSVENFRALTPYICDYGNVAVFVTLDDDGVQTPLPHTRYYGGYIDGEYKTWSSTIDYEYNPGFINFFYTTSDFGYFDYEPGSWTFRVVLTK